MGPTCSIIYENEPLEKNVMKQKPRPLSTTFFSGKELGISILQGLMITAGILLVYQYSHQQFGNESVTRTMVFVTLITANVFLTLVNRSFYYSILTTIQYKNVLVPAIIVITMILTFGFIHIESISIFFQFTKISFNQAAFSILTGMISVLWFEILKIYFRSKQRLSRANWSKV